MTIAELMQAMADAGAPMDAILIAVKAVEDERQKETDRLAADAAKTARYRQRGGGAISQELRQSVFSRDKHKCVYCLSPKNLSCDHVIPVSKGGGTTFENLATACRSCNSSKRDKTPAEWGRA